MSGAESTPFSMPSAVRDRVTAVSRLLATGDVDAAEAILGEVVSIAPTWKPARLELAKLLLSGGRETEALDPLREAARLCPPDARVFLTLGATAQNVGRIAEAEHAFRLAVLVDPRDTQATIRLARRVALRGRMGAARRIGARLRCLIDCGIGADHGLMGVYMDLAWFREAATIARRLLVVAPADVDCLRHFALGLLRISRSEPAHAWAMRGRAAAPRARLTALVLCETALRLMKFDIVEDAVRSTGIDPNRDPELAFWLARALMGQWRAAEAEPMLSIAEQHPTKGRLVPLLRLGAKLEDFRIGGGAGGSGDSEQPTDRTDRL